MQHNDVNILFDKQTELESVCQVQISKINHKNINDGNYFELFSVNKFCLSYKYS